VAVQWVQSAVVSGTARPPLTGQGWREQWARVNRWYHRFQSISTGAAPQAPSAEYYEDEVRAFFVESYHLKDWLRNDPAVPIGDQEIEAAVNKSISLRLCGDLANGAKHLVLSSDPRRPPKVAADTMIGARNYAAMVGEPGGPLAGTMLVRYTIVAGGQSWNAFDVATEAVRDWERFLKSKGLL
jgi:hypothetical protein